MILLNFHLNNPAVQMIEISTKPGATLKITGVDAGSTYTKTDYFTSQSNSGWYMLDNDSSFSFVINYLVEYASGRGNGIGKITGTGVINGAGDVTVTAGDVYNNAITYTITTSSYNRTVNLNNPIIRNGIEYTTGITRYRIIPTPSNASIELIDARDDSILPPVALSGAHLNYVFPVPNPVSSTTDIKYIVWADNFVSATGKFAVTRTASTSNTNTVVFSTNGDEESYTYNDTSNPRTANITLVSIATDFDISFAIYSNVYNSIVTVIIDGIEQIPDDRNHYIIPFPTTDKSLFYTVEAENFHTVHGELLLKPSGLIEDITSQAEIDGTIDYNFDGARSLISIQMMPAIIIIPTGQRTAYAPVGRLLLDCFKDRLNLYGSKLLGGKMELISQNPLYDYEIIGIEITGKPVLAHNAFRTFNDAVKHLTLIAKFSTLRDIVEMANQTYPGKNFTNYYEYLLFYYKTIYVSPFGTDCSNITSLDELPPLDLSTIWAGNVWIDRDDYDGTTEDEENGLVYEALGPIYAYIENDGLVAALAEKLIAEYAFNLTLDNIKAGPIPYSVAEMTEQNKGLQFYDYVNHTLENILQVAKMLDFIIPSNGTHRFTQVAISSNGSYAHNGFQNNALKFDFDINFILKIPGYPYKIEYYTNIISDDNLITSINSPNEYDEGYQLTKDDVDHDFEIDWIDAFRPANYYPGVMQGNYPIISSNLEENKIIVLYTLIPPGPFAFPYRVEYYKDLVSANNLITIVNGLTEFDEGYQLTKEDIDNDLGINWIDAFKLTGYYSGVIQGNYPIISSVPAENKVIILYVLIPPGPFTFPYRVEYYKDLVSTNNLITLVNGLAEFDEGYQLTKEDVDDDLGINWINAYRPIGYYQGTIQGSYPIISSIPAENKVIVLYIEIPPGPFAFPYQIEYYKKSVSPNNFIALVEGLTEFDEGYQLTKEDVDDDLGDNWLNTYRPINYRSGVVQGDYPIISINLFENRVIVLYKYKNPYPFDYCCFCLKYRKKHRKCD